MHACSDSTKLKTQLVFFEGDVRFLVELLPVAAPRLGRRTVLTLPLFPPPQKNRSPPSDSSPETATPSGISSLSRTSPVRGSTRRKSLSSPSQVACHSSPSIQVTPVTKRLDSIVRRIAHPERPFGPRQPRVTAAAGRRDRGEHSAGLPQARGVTRWS